MVDNSKSEETIRKQLKEIEDEILGEGNRYKNIDSDLIIAHNKDLTTWQRIRLVLKWVLGEKIRDE